MPSKKKKYNARFPPARIKKIMQTDEEVGKVAAAVPVIISRALELFIDSLIEKTAGVTRAKNAKTLSSSHIKQAIQSEKTFDFLQDLVKNVPDHQTEEEMDTTAPSGSGTVEKKPKVPRPRKPREEGARGPGRPRKVKVEEKKESASEAEPSDEETETDEEQAGEEENYHPSQSNHAQTSGPDHGLPGEPILSPVGQFGAPLTQIPTPVMPGSSVGNSTTSAAAALDASVMSSGIPTPMVTSVPYVLSSPQQGPSVDPNLSNMQGEQQPLFSAQYPNPTQGQSHIPQGQGQPHMPHGHQPSQPLMSQGHQPGQPLMSQGHPGQPLMSPGHQSGQHPMPQGHQLGQPHMSQGQPDQPPMSQGYHPGQAPMSHGHQPGQPPMSQGYQPGQPPMSQGHYPGQPLMSPQHLQQGVPGAPAGFPMHNMGYHPYPYMGRGPSMGQLPYAHPQTGPDHPNNNMHAAYTQSGMQQYPPPPHFHPARPPYMMPPMETKDPRFMAPSGVPGMPMGPPPPLFSMQQNQPSNAGDSSMPLDMSLAGKSRLPSASTESTSLQRPLLTDAASLPRPLVTDSASLPRPLVTDSASLPRPLVTDSANNNDLTRLPHPSHESQWSVNNTNNQSTGMLDLTVSKSQTMGPPPLVKTSQNQSKNSVTENGRHLQNNASVSNKKATELKSQDSNVEKTVSFPGLANIMNMRPVKTNVSEEADDDYDS